MPNFSERSYEPEIMDDLDASQGEFVYQTLRELATINHWLGGNAVTRKGLDAMVMGWDGSRPLRIADLGCGGGDMLVVIHQWAQQRGISVELVGVDFNPDIIRFAKENTANYPELQYAVEDVFSEDFNQQPFDIVVCSLFLHHFTDDALATLFRKLVAQTTLGVLINDLHRHPLAYYSIRWLTRWFSKSQMVKYDAPLSVLRSFRVADWRRILGEAAIGDFHLRWRWAFRWEVILPGRLPLGAIAGNHSSASSV